METNCFVLLGTNMGDRLENLHQAINCIGERIGSIQKKSSIYETEPWQMQNNTWFYNQVIQISTLLAPLEIIEVAKSIEKEMGRIPFQPNVEEKYGSRIIDIDILYHGDNITKSQALNLPHPRLHLRKFTLIPMVELAPNLVHPILRKTQNQLLYECEDIGMVRPL